MHLFSYTIWYSVILVRRSKINIFYVHPDPEVAAQSMVDRHVVKMILETAQLLSTAHRVLDGEEYVGQSQSGRKAKRWRLNGDLENILYSATHINHPSAVWTRETSGNYDWLARHLLALGREYSYRYDRVHSTIDKLGDVLITPPQNIAQQDVTLMPSCMADDYIVGDDPITNYRNYYNKGKTNLLRWTKRFPPAWIEGEIILAPGAKHIYSAGRQNV